MDGGEEASPIEGVEASGAVVAAPGSPKVRSAAAKKPLASWFSGSNAKTACARSRTLGQSSLETASSASSRRRSICLWSLSGNRPPGPETRQRLAHRGWHRQDRRLRPGGGHRPFPSYHRRDDGGYTHLDITTKYVRLSWSSGDWSRFR